LVVKVINERRRKGATLVLPVAFPISNPAN